MLATLMVNTRVAVQAPAWPRPLPTRVDDVDDDVLTVTDPLVPGFDAPPVGTTLEVSWPGITGPRHLPVVLEDVDDGRLPCWRLRALGPALSAQRRSAVRVVTLVDAVVSCGGFVVGVHVVDLSEAGVHVVAPAPAPLVAGELVHVTLDLVGDTFQGAASVVRAEETQGRLHAGCRFVELALSEEARLRRFVLRRQGAERARLRL